MARTWTPSKRQMLIGLLLASAASSLLWPHGWGDLPRNWLKPLLGPVEASLSIMSLNVKRNAIIWWSGEIDDDTASQWLEKNPALQRQLSRYVDRQLTNQVVDYEQKIAELQRQRDQIAGWAGGLREFPCLLLPAKVIAAEPTPYQRLRTLHPRNGSASPGDYVTTRGLMTERATALPGTPAVLAASSMVGRIISSGAWTAQLQLVTDSDFRINAFVLRMVDAAQPRYIIDTVANQAKLLKPGDPAILVNLRGCGDGLISAEVPAAHNILPGDQVITTGDDGRLPKRILIGRVRLVEPVAQAPQHVLLHVEPGAQLDMLEDVYIVLPQAREGSL